MTLARRLQVVGSATDNSWQAAAVKVAFATSDMKRVDQHFGAAQAFAIYAIDQERSSLVEASEFGKLAMDGNEDKLSAKIGVLHDCVAVYSQAVGASAIGQLRAKGIQPIKVPHGAEISELVTSLQDELRQGPSHWLAKAIANSKPTDPSRFDAMEAEGWEE